MMTKEEQKHWLRVEKKHAKWTNTTQSYFSASKAGSMSIETFLQLKFKKKEITKHQLVQELLAFNRQLTFLCIWQGTPTFHISTFPCFAVSRFFSFFCVWVTPRRFHCRVNQAETPIHQTGMCVLSLLTGGIHREKKKKKGQWVILAVFGLPSKASYHPRATLYLPHRGLRQRGDGRIPAGLTQSPLMEPEVERPCTQQQNLKITTWALGT